MAEIAKQWSAIVAAVGLVITLGIRWVVTERTVETHTLQIKENQIIDQGQQKLIEDLAQARLQQVAVDEAAKRARTAICRELREAGKIVKGECPPLEP